MELKSGDRGRKVLDALHRAALFCDRKIGWNRIGGRGQRHIIAIAVAVLYPQSCSKINGSEVLDALVTTDWRDVALSALSSPAAISPSRSTTCSRCARSVDRMCRIGSRRSPASHQLFGRPQLWGERVHRRRVRYRIYSAWGLNAIDVAKICFVAGLTFWLGNATVLGLGIAYAPLAATAIDQLPAWLNRGGRNRDPDRAGALCRAGCGAAPGSSVGEGWSVALPGGPLTLLQIGIGIVDLGFMCAGDVHPGAGGAQYRLRHAPP